MTDIKLAKLSYTFRTKPLLIGGKAMEYYGLRQSGEDIDFVITEHDYAQLVSLYPRHLKNLAGDLGLCIYEFEIWTSICLFNYGNLATNAIELEHYSVISLEKLLFLKTLAIENAKNERDVRLLIKKILDIQYGKDSLKPERK